MQTFKIDKKMTEFELTTSENASKAPQPLPNLSETRQKYARLQLLSKIDVNWRAFDAFYV